MFTIKPTTFNNELIIVENEIHNKFCGRFFKEWSFMIRTKGVWYTLVKDSLVRTIMFLNTYQFPDFQVVQGIIKLDKFVRMLEFGEILFNVCYVIEDEE